MVIARPSIAGGFSIIAIPWAASTTLSISFLANSGSGDLAAAEADCNLDLVAILQKLDGVFQLELKIVVVRLGTHPDTFQVAALLLLVGIAVLLGLFILMFAVIHDLANRWRGSRGHLDQIQSALPRQGERISHGHYSVLHVLVIDKADVAHSNWKVTRGAQNLLVDAEILVDKPLPLNLYDTT